MSDNREVAYTSLRRDIIKMIVEKPTNVLDVGCSSGVLLEYIKQVLGAELTVGIEVDEAFANEASGRIDQLIQCDLDSLCDDVLPRRTFDLIILADVLEHTKNPATVLATILKSATDEANVIISLPNIQHWTAIKNLIMGEWPARDRGLFDRTHLRFFTFKSIRQLADESGLTIVSVGNSFRILDRRGGFVNRYSRRLDLWPVRRYFIYQYVVSLKKRRDQ